MFKRLLDLFKLDTTGDWEDWDLEDEDLEDDWDEEDDEEM